MGSENAYLLIKTLSLINRSTKRTQRLANQHCFPFKTNGRKCDLECPIHGIINSCEIEGAYLGRVLSIFWPKKLHNDFFWKKKKKKHFSKFERWIITCFIVSVYRFFYYFMFPEKIDIILADRLELWTSIYLLVQVSYCQRQFVFL